MNKKKKKYLDEINAIPKEKSMGYYAPKASEINGIPTHNLPEIEIVAENPYKLTDYQKAQASKIKDNFRRGKYLKEQDYYNRTGKNKFTEDINYIGTESQKRLANVALSAIPGIGTVQPFIKYENGKVKGDFSKEAFIQSGINTVLDFVPVGDLIVSNVKQSIKQKKLKELFREISLYNPVEHTNKVEYTPSILTNSSGKPLSISLSRPMLDDTKIALNYQIKPRLKQLTQKNTPIDRQLEKRINKTIEQTNGSEIQIISDNNMNKLQDKNTGAYYNHDTKNIVLRSKMASSVPTETHEASHAITNNIGVVTRGRRLDNARKVLGEFTGYAENYYSEVPEIRTREDLRTDEFISDVNAVRQVLLSKKDPNNNLIKNILANGKDLSEKDINELILIGQNHIINKYTDDEIINAFENISGYGKEFVEKYKNNPNFPAMLKQALYKVSVATGLITTQNNNK